MLHKVGMSVTQVLYKVCEGWAGCLGVCVVLAESDGVNQVDKRLGQPRQVMTAGTYGPSGQPLFDVVTPSIDYVKWHRSEVVLSWHPGCI